jgi:hypothetical protein
MDLQEIEVLIDKDGQVQLHVRGVKGGNCLEITREVEASLGSHIILREMTPESQENSGGQVLDNRTIKIQDK